MCLFHRHVQIHRKKMKIYQNINILSLDGIMGDLILFFIPIFSKFIQYNAFIIKKKSNLLKKPHLSKESLISNDN